MQNNGTGQFILNIFTYVRESWYYKIRDLSLKNITTHGAQGLK